MSNIAHVQQIYAAFGRGDIPAILARLADDVEWEYGGTPEVPWLKPLRGVKEVPKFFEAVGGIEFSKLDFKKFFETDNIVVVLLDVTGRVKATSRGLVEEDEVHIWHFNAEGKVTRFRHRADTLMQAKAARQ